MRSNGVGLLPGARRWLDTLHAEGWRQALASSAPRANIEAILQELSLRDVFGAIVGAEDVTHGKPDPEVFLRAGERLGVLPRRSVVVEDAAAGVEAGRRGGMRTIGVNADRPLDADVYAGSLDELPDDAFERLVPAGPEA